MYLRKLPFLFDLENSEFYTLAFTLFPPFLQIFDKWLFKFNSLSISIPNNFTEF